MYDDPTLVAFFENHPKHGAQEFIDALMRDVRVFTGGAPQSDDITAMYVMRGR